MDEVSINLNTRQRNNPVELKRVLEAVLLSAQQPMSVL